MFHGPDEHFDISLFLNSVWNPHFILDFQQYSVSMLLFTLLYIVPWSYVSGLGS